jgi:hypothetical protein
LKKKILKLTAFIKPDHGRWDSYPSIGDGKKIIFIKKSDTTFYTPFLFITPGLVSESCHESTFKLIRHHNFNDVFFSVGVTWTFNKYNNIEK